MKRRLAALALIAMLAPERAAHAQDVALRLPPQPWYAGVPFEISVIAEGFEEEPQPEVQVKPPSGARLELAGMTPSISSSITVSGGVMRQKRSVRMVYRYRLHAREPGTYKVGPFRVSQGGVEKSTETLTLNLLPVPRTDEVKLQIVLPERAVYPGERVPIRIEWLLSTRVRAGVHDYVIQSTLFERTDAFQFIDPPRREGDSGLQIHTPQGRVELKSHAERRSSGGRSYVAIIAERELVPLRAGTYELEPASVVLDHVTQWRRGLLGSRSPVAIEKLRAEDRPRTLEVRPIPLSGRPASFAGAVGQGFSIEASTDRSVVQVGDPITLTLRVRGDGNLERAGLPDLSADGGLSPQRFRLPSSDVAGLMEDGEKVFQLQIRALDPALSELPAIAYSWFDPELGAFQTVRSREIALSVRGATMIAADDVIGPAPPVEEDEPAETAPGALDLTGADLSIVTDSARLLRRPRAALSAPAQAALYLGSMFSIVFALWARRRADVDPVVAERRRTLQAERRAIVETAGQPHSKALGRIAEALRAMARASTRSPAGLDAFLADCEAVIYAPDGGADHALDPALAQRALELADALLEASP